MKKIIKGKLYDTDTAIEIGNWSNGYPWSDFHCEYETLYKKKTGEYFLFAEGGPLSEHRERIGDGWTYGESIIPMSIGEAKSWAEGKLDMDEYISEFGCPEE